MSFAYISSEQYFTEVFGFEQIILSPGTPAMNRIIANNL